jgi:hypothetical protein
MADEALFEPPLSQALSNADELNTAITPATIFACLVIVFIESLKNTVKQ